jgi:hypothetical protein
MTQFNDMLMRKFIMRKLYRERVLSDATEKDLDSMTKAQIVEYGASIGVTLSMSLTKTIMIQTLKATPEFESEEVKRKALNPLLW